MMESNGGNENLPPATLCRMGCGFYGNAAFEGMCSKCYKDAVKRKQQNPSPPPAVGGRASPPGKSVSSSTSAAAEAGAPAAGAECSPVSRSLSSSPTVDTTPSVETGTPTVSTASGNGQDKASSEDKSEEGATGGAEAASASDGDTPDKNKKPKKNRCHSCKKKVGLTGFQCRCGGLFCSVHRYSDKHDCKFNYKELAQEQIRKNNPVVVSEKIQKI